MFKFHCLQSKKQKQKETVSETEGDKHLSDSFNQPNLLALNRQSMNIFFQCFKGNKVSANPRNPLIPDLCYTGFGYIKFKSSYKSINSDNNNSNGIRRPSVNEFWETILTPDEINLQKNEFLLSVSDISSSIENEISSLGEKLSQLAKCGWYWGALTRAETEEKLQEEPDGAFLVRDSSDHRYVLTLSFRSHSQTFHTHIDYIGGKFSLQSGPNFYTVESLINYSMSRSVGSQFPYVMHPYPADSNLMMSVKLTRPISRFTKVRPLQHLCRCVIREYTRADLISQLPLPQPIKDYLEDSRF